jgi:hypothetical protein
VTIALESIHIHYRKEVRHMQRVYLAVAAVLVVAARVGGSFVAVQQLDETQLAFPCGLQPFEGCELYLW